MQSFVNIYTFDNDLHITQFFAHAIDVVVHYNNKT